MAADVWKKGEAAEKQEEEKINFLPIKRMRQLLLLRYILLSPSSPAEKSDPISRLPIVESTTVL